jgi:hypothetical protein
MNAFDLIKSAKSADGRGPYCDLDVCHTHECPVWRIGNKHAPCNCGGEAMLALLKGNLKSCIVPDELAKRIRGW